MPRSPSVPSYRHHKPSGQAVVTIRTAEGERRDVYLGTYNSPESRAEYGRIVAELATSPAARSSPARASSGPTVDQVLLAFWKYAEPHYRRPDGKPSTELEELRRSVIPLRKLYGHTPAADFGPKALAAVRQQMIAAGWCRSLVNHRIDRVRRVFRWATAEELVPVTVYQALRTLAGLQKGRTDVRESKAIVPVDPAHVAAVLPRLNRYVRAMAELQRLTGMRPGEVCALTFAEVDRSGELWVYRPTQHKTAHRGKPRAVPFGPKARALLLTFVRNDCPPPRWVRAHRLERSGPERCPTGRGRRL